ncbi:ketoacyl-ACP synthase III [bacterium]|nr:ketoacyl-ACP synthase III [bacterium]
MSRITAIASYLPDQILSNKELSLRFASWSAEKIYSKTGILERRIAADHETAGDLAVKAAQKLVNQNQIDVKQIDFLILVTQTPDQALPSTSCFIHQRLGLQESCGTIDINQGCSGYIYGLSVADGLISSGTACTVLLLTADTYSKLIDPSDQSVATLFGDGACASLIQRDLDEKQRCIGPTQFGTDGRGDKFLCCNFAGWRIPPSQQTPLRMDGSAVLSFTLSVIPRCLNTYMKDSNLHFSDYDHVVFHQANKFLLQKLYSKIGVEDKGIISLERTGNTVSSSIPFVLEEILNLKASKYPRRILLAGFGVGFSWGFTTILL